MPKLETMALPVNRITQEDFIAIKLLIKESAALPDPIKCKKGRQIGFDWIYNFESTKVLEARNNPRIIRAFCSKTISIDAHSKFLYSYSQIPRIDFMLVDIDSISLVGSVYLTLTSLGLEIGKYISNEAYLSAGVAKRSFQSFRAYLNNYFPESTKIISKTRKDNLANIALNSSIGFTSSGDLPGDFLLMEANL